MRRIVYHIQGTASFCGITSDFNPRRIVDGLILLSGDD